MMTTGDVRRIGELFYPEVGSAQYECSLKGFLQDAFATYAQRRPAHGEPRAIAYPGIHADGRLAVLIASAHGRPDLFRSRITAPANALAELLPHLAGRLAAEYDGLPVETLPAHVQRAATRRSELWIPVGPLVLFRDGTGRIRRATAQDAATLDDTLRGILTHADRIEATHDHRADDDPARELIHETCTAVRKDDHVQWTYATRVATTQPLPADSLPRLETYFALAQPIFSPLSYHRRTCKTPAEEAV